MNILVPIDITAAMILAGTSVAEPAASETAWVSAGTYAVGDRRIRSTTHRVYECVQAHTGRTAYPENDAAYWIDAAPTQRFAPFDQYTSTATTGTTSMTFVLQPGFFNSISLYGLVGSQVSVSIKDAPGGSAIYTYAADLTVPPVGWYEWLFVPPQPITKLVLKDLPIRPAAEITITVSAAAGQPVAIGMINCGDYRPLIGDADWGGTESGASVEPVTYSYINTAADGTVSIVKRHAATGMRASVKLPRERADTAVAMVQEVLDKPVSWIATDLDGFQSLNVFGLGNGSCTYDNHAIATFSLNVKGMI